MACVIVVLLPKPPWLYYLRQPESASRRSTFQTELCAHPFRPIAAGSSEEVPLMDVKSLVLSKVIEFCKHHVDQKLPEIEKVKGAPCRAVRGAA